MKLKDVQVPHAIYGDYSTIDSKAIEQFKGALDNDFVLQGALMPDAHLGYSLPIGAVVATDGVIVPAWVGYDIGCGMCAVPTTFNVDDIREHAAAIHHAIHQEVPVGNQKRPRSISCPALDILPHTKVINHQAQVRDAWKQIGTLGGGNHFIEIGEDVLGRAWIVIHSGSRGVGHGTAGHYMKAFAGAHGITTGNFEGHLGLPENHPLAKDYIKDLNWCLEYALANRRMMIQGVYEALRSVGLEGQLCYDELINRNHNHAERKEGQWIHRKGATHAEEGMMGVIPGNMQDGSFIVMGLGNPSSLSSSSHGAGRVLSRSQAKKRLDPSDFVQSMAKARIVSDASDKTIDESPKAYKDINEVMAQQEDLVVVMNRVVPIINVKG